MAPPENFFDRQERARTRSFWLLLCYVLGVCALTLAPYFLIMWVTQTTVVERSVYHSYPKVEYTWWDAEIFAWTFGGALLTVLGATFYKWGDLSGRPARLAEELGGSPLEALPTDEGTRRLRNVAEEMCIAAGLPVPQLYVLDEEEGINAFAMGTPDGRGVVGVTRGALEQLSRDELQGVVAHEIGHLHNRDTRLQIRLIALAFGLFALTIVGRILLRSGSVRGDGNRNKNAAPIALFGLAMLLCGFIGIFFGQLMQAAVSRQREHLADADATQFTRNPAGLADALKRIGGWQARGHVNDPNAMEAAHLFFVPAVGSLFATHPPLEERIRALDPDWDGKFLPPRGDGA